MKLALLLLALLVGPMSTAHAFAQGPTELPPRLSLARDRWEELTPKERQTVRKNYRLWKEMSEDQRDELRRRAQQLKTEREKVERELPADVKRDLERLDGRKQRQVLSDLTEERVKENGRRIRSKMPEDFMLRLEAAPPEARPELLQKFKRQQRGRVSRAALEILGGQLELPADEVRELQARPDDERTRAVLELRQRLSERQLPDGGLPHGLTWEQWDEWSRLSPEEFFGRIVDYRQERMTRLLSNERPGAEPSGAAPGTDRSARERAPNLAGDGSGRPPPRAPFDEGSAHRRGRSDAPLPRVLKRLAEAVSPDPRDALELIELSDPERKAGMARRRRARCMQLIQGEHLLPEARVQQLEELTTEEFFDLVRRMLVHTGHLDPTISDRDELDAADAPPAEAAHAPDDPR